MTTTYIAELDGKTIGKRTSKTRTYAYAIAVGPTPIASKIQALTDALHREQLCDPSSWLVSYLTRQISELQAQLHAGITEEGEWGVMSWSSTLPLAEKAAKTARTATYPGTPVRIVMALKAR